jgi:hypothetical protein
MLLKPLKITESQARVKGGRASGGTRYFGGKFRGEDKMIRLMQKALDKKNKEEKLTTSDVIDILNESSKRMKASLRELEKKYGVVK